LLDYKYNVSDKIIKNELILFDKQNNTDVIFTIQRVLLGIIIGRIDIGSRLNLSEC
jgi:hypothetical protein